MHMPYSDQIIWDEKQYEKHLTMSLRKHVMIKVLFVVVVK